MINCMQHWHRVEHPRSHQLSSPLMKPKIDLVSMFLVIANGRFPVPVVKKRK